FLNRLIAPLRRRELHVTEICPAFPTNHLQRPLSAWQEGCAQRFLAVHYLLQRGFALLSGNRTAQINEAANMICYIRNRYRRRLPQLPLRKSQGLEAGLSTVEPLFKERAFVLGLLSFSTARVHVYREHHPPANRDRAVPRFARRKELPYRAH